MSGMFITFEGGEGSGKSTQIGLLADALQAAGVDCVRTREPGGTPGAERVRELLVNGHADAWDPLAETVLFYAARMEHVTRLIKPALADGKVVLCDRFADSTLVYQGEGKGISLDYIHMLHHLLLTNFEPNITFVFDIAPEVGLKRAATRHGNENRFESMDVEFHRKIRSGFLEVVKDNPGRCVLLDASGSIEQVHTQVLQAVRSRLNIKLGKA